MFKEIQHMVMMLEMAVMSEEFNVSGIYNCRKLFRAGPG